MSKKLTKAATRIVRDDPLAAKLYGNVTHEGDCWIYGAGKTYGTIATRTGTRRAHRVAYELFCGPIPDGYLVCHHCDRPACVNPLHLFVGTYSDNVRDMMRKGRQVATITSSQDHFRAGHAPRGEDGSGAKIDETTAVAILDLAANGENTGDLAAHFGINRTTVQRLLRGETWRHLPRPDGLPRRVGNYSRGRAALSQAGDGR